MGIVIVLKFFVRLVAKFANFKTFPDAALMPFRNLSKPL